MTVGDLVWHEDEVTAAEAIAITQLTGGGWETLYPLHSPLSTAAVVATLLAVRGGQEPDVAWLIVGAMPAGDLLACVTKG